MKHKSFIVPHDFTPVADIALNYAIETSAHSHTTIHILHVVESTDAIDDAVNKIDNIIAQHAQEGITMTNNVRVGNIFKDISLFAEEHQAELIFMGTHGAHGWQNIVGSHALRVVTSSQIPFVIVQEKAPKQGGFNDIVVPLDFHSETLQKLSTVAKIAGYFNSMVHIVTPSESDEDLKEELNDHVSFCKRYFQERNIQMDAQIIPSKDFHHEVIRHARSIEADLIAIMNLNRSSFLGIFNANYEQQIITNDALIPVLILNPIQTQEVYANWFV
ncbi:MAG: universal stress protein [Flavobacteriia bacterium]|nr:universal stress protein [Flavobacteriia bacterium]